MKKILLVYPRCSSATNPVQASDDVLFDIFKKIPFADAALPTIAALTSDDFAVKIVDERIEKIDFEEPCDIVGITGMITQRMRAREIAREFAQRGRFVVCGGPDASISPEEWFDVGNTLVIGEAEYTWPEFLSDYLAARPRNVYRQSRPVDLKDTPRPRYDLLKTSKYLGATVERTRGCPFACSFCDVKLYRGPGIRHKPVENIIQELDTLYRLGHNGFFIADDNFTGRIAHAKQLLREILKWYEKIGDSVYFTTQIAITAAKDDELLNLMANAGVTRVLVGIESPNKKTLEEASKFHNMKSDLREDIAKIQSYGILVMPSTIVGFDNDDVDVFEEHEAYFSGRGLPLNAPLILEATKGTDFTARMAEEGRLLDKFKKLDLFERGLSSDDLSQFSFEPKMGLLPLLDGYRRYIARIFSSEYYLEESRLLLAQLGDAKTPIPTPKVKAKDIVDLTRLLLFYFRLDKDQKKVWLELFQLGRKSPNGHASLTTMHLMTSYYGFSEYLKALPERRSLTA